MSNISVSDLHPAHVEIASDKSVEAVRGGAFPLVAATLVAGGLVTLGSYIYQQSQK